MQFTSSCGQWPIVIHPVACKDGGTQRKFSGSGEYFSSFCHIFIRFFSDIRSSVWLFAAAPLMFCAWIIWPALPFEMKKRLSFGLWVDPYRVRRFEGQEGFSARHWEQIIEESGRLFDRASFFYNGHQSVIRIIVKDNEVTVFVYSLKEGLRLSSHCSEIDWFVISNNIWVPIFCNNISTNTSFHTSLLFLFYFFIWNRSEHSLITLHLQGLVYFFYFFGHE